MKLYLASQSPRRQEILALLDIPFEVLSVDFDERAYEAQWRLKHKSLDFSQLSAGLALGKAEAASATLLQANEHDFIILTADTIVVLDDTLYGKGEHREQSIAMLAALSGRTHQVTTSVCVLDEAGRSQTVSVTTDVSFAHLSRAEIEHYVDSAAPFDKAGAYGIQEKAAIFVEGIRGDFYNVVGLPARATYRLLESYLPLLR